MAVIQVLLKGWYWIAGATFAAALIAVILAPRLPKVFLASTTIVLTEPDVIFQFDPRIQTQFELPPTEGLTTLAKSDGILQLVLESEIGRESPPRARVLEDFKKDVDASLSGTVLELAVKSSTPKQAADLANEWASILVGQLQRLYGSTSTEPLDFEDAADEALDAWQDAQADLVDFQGTNREKGLAQRLIALEGSLAHTLRSRDHYEALEADIEDLTARLQDLPPDAEADLRDDLVTLMIALRSLRTSIPFGFLVSASQDFDRWIEVSNGPFEGMQLSITSSDEGLVDETIIDQIRYLHDIRASIGEAKNSLDERAIRIEAELIERQKAHSGFVEEKATLEQERDLTRDAYQLLARKAQEAALSYKEQGRVARVASTAPTPHDPVSLGPIGYAVLASISVLGLASLAVLGSARWRGL